LSETSPIPTLLALLTCESVIVDAETQKKTLVGLFDRIQATSVPLQIAGLGLYAKLVEGSGHYTFKIRMVSLKDESQVLDIAAQADWPVAEAPLEFVVNFRGVPVPAFGDYEIQLFADDIYLGRAPLRVDQLERLGGGLEVRVPRSASNR
jgi:hypothetical protein